MSNYNLSSSHSLSPSVLFLFSKLSTRHRFLLLLPAIVTSILSGGIAPFMTLVVGQAFNAFAQFPTTPNPPQSTKQTLLNNVGIAALELLALALGSFALASLTSSLWIWTGEYNVMALRKCVYSAVTKKDMVWFDTKMGSEGTVQSMHDEQGPLGAGGLMSRFTRSVSYPLSYELNPTPTYLQQRNRRCPQRILSRLWNAPPTSHYSPHLSSPRIHPFLCTNSRHPLHRPSPLPRPSNIPIPR